MAKLRNAIAISLLLQRSFTSTVTDSYAAAHLKHLSRTFSVSSNDYLVSSLSLSPDSVKRKPISIKSTSNADSVIALFTDYGFTHTHLAKIFSLRPMLLTFNPHNNLKPKLDFLAQSGIFGDTLIHIATNHPKILQRSLLHQILPCIDFLKTFFCNNPRYLNSFFLQNRSTFVIGYFSENTPVNVEMLRREGVPDSSILRLFLLGGGPQHLAQDPEHFSTSLKEIMDMGCDLSSAMFPYVFRGYCGMSKEKWVSKMELPKGCFGWIRDEQVLALFVKEPAFMTLSLENLQKSLQFFIKTLGWTPNYIAKYHNLLAYSLETRILPRFSVLDILESKGLVKKVSIPNAFKMSEDMFLRLFVN